MWVVPFISLQYNGKYFQNMNYRWFSFVIICYIIILLVEQRGFMKTFYINIGNRIKEKRLELKLTRDSLAFNANISNKFLYDVELGKKGISAESLYKIARALGVSADWLLGE